MNTYADILIIGSGIAGLTFALKTAEGFPDKKIIIATKSDVLESNTRYAQGGIAGVLDLHNDSFEQHIQDTLKAGDFLNNVEIVSMVIKEAPERIYEIIRWGASFDIDSNGNYQFGLEGGHCANRILHHKDITGLEIQRKLLQQVLSKENIEIRSHAFAKELIIEKNIHSYICHGASFLNSDTNEAFNILSSVTFLSTGGAGQVYLNTTNPVIATGDGIAMAHRAGARIENMEFIQFHPTSFYNPGENPSFLISEAVRGMGAILVDHKGESFMENYSSQASLAPRDIVARAIENEIKTNYLDHVYLDCTHLNIDEFINHFPTIYNKCKTSGIDPSKDYIPVLPAAHYLCGGIKTDQWGRTTISNLYAAGECASTGLHGANRLASNSLLEALVFAHNAFTHIKATKPFEKEYSTFNITDKFPDPTFSTTDVNKIRQEVKTNMTKGAGIVRSYNELHELYSQLNELDLQLNKNTSNEVGYWETKNMLSIARSITEASLKRKENRGLYYNKDLTSTIY